MTVESRAERVSDAAYAVELTTRVDGRPWATHDVEIRRDGDRSVVTYEYAADRRFGLRRVPQRFVAKRYRNDALEAQGYTVLDRRERYEV